MEEIIARKEGEGILVYALVAALICLFDGLAIAGMVMEPAIAVAFALFLILTAPVLIVCIYFIVEITKTPKIAITFENAKLRFANGFECSPDEVEKVNYKCAQSRWRRYTWGELIIQACAKEIKYKYIADVASVHDRLLELRLESREKN